MLNMYGLGKSGKWGVILVGLPLCYMTFFFPSQVLIFFLFCMFFLLIWQGDFLFWSSLLCLFVCLFVKDSCIFIGISFFMLGSFYYGFVEYISVHLSWTSFHSFTSIIFKFGLFMLFQISWMLFVKDSLDLMLSLTYESNSSIFYSWNSFSSSWYLLTMLES